MRNLVGQPILESILGLMDVTAYVSHVGTLQHKISFFSLAPGIIHGPKHQMTNIESGAFQTVAGRVPVYLEPKMIEDIAQGSERGSGFNDYKITDIPGAVSRLLDLIHSFAHRG